MELFENKALLYGIIATILLVTIVIAVIIIRKKKTVVSTVTTSTNQTKQGSESSKNNSTTSAGTLANKKEETAATTTKLENTNASTSKAETVSNIPIAPSTSTTSSTNSSGTAGGSTLTSTATAAIQQPDSVSFFQDCNFGGYELKLKPGTYPSTLLSTIPPFKDNDISSIKVPTGLKATVYIDEPGSGELVFTQDISCLVGLKFPDGQDANDKISSIKVEKI